jgi:ABC-type multidrug transport system fused ATPase/permease subunit
MPQYQHKFLTNLSHARREFLAAQEFEHIPFDPRLEALLERIERLEGDSGLRPGDSGKISIRSLWMRSLTVSGPLILYSVAWCSLFAVCTLVAVVATRSMIETLGNFSLSLSFGLIFLFAEVVSHYARYRESSLRVQVGLAVQFYILSLINAKLPDLDPDCRSKFSSGNLKTLIGSDVENIAELVWAALWGFVPCLLLTLVLVPALYSMLGLLGLLAVGLVFLQLPMALLATLFLERLQARVQRARDALTTKVGEWLRSMRLVRYLGWQKAISHDIASALQQYTRSDIPRYLTECLMYSLSCSWWMIPVLGLLVFSQLLQVPLSIGAFFGALWALGYLSTYVQWLPYPISRYASAAVGMRRVADLLEAPALSRALRAAEPLADGAPPAARYLLITDLRAGYQGREQLHIHYLRLDLREFCAVVGAVGSGKSTLLKILAGELIPLAGCIQWESEDGQRYDLWQKPYYEQWRAQIAVAHQEPFLSNTSIAHNISLGMNAPAAQLDAAAQAAQLTEDIEEFPRRFEQEVGETGINLSGGQKARVSLARAFFSGRRIFLLDDPLSAVDTRTERRLVDAIFSRATGGVLVSHRFGELARCARVLVLAQGKIVEQGTPTELATDPNSAFSAFLRSTEQHTQEYSNGL